MEIYVWQADLWCAGCGKAVQARLLCEGVKPGKDSDGWPQGPYWSGDGEADHPQHCAGCDVFLEHPLTADGMEYVRQAVKAKPQHGVAARVWAPFYGIGEG